MSAIEPTPVHVPLPEAIVRIEIAGEGLLGIGIPRCPASALLAASLEALRDEMPEATVAMSTFETPGDWALRETHLWPRGIRVSRASVPILARLTNQQWTMRPGAAPVDQLRAWLTGEDGPPASGPGRLREGERRVIEASAQRRAQRLAAHSRGIRRGAE